MKNFKLIFLILFCGIAFWANSQDARFAGMANVSVMQKGFWSVGHNQAGLSDIENVEAGIGYQNRFKLAETSTQMIASAFHTRTGNLAVSFNRFGYSNYSQNNVGLAYARNLGKYFSAGLQFDYLYYHQSEDYGNNGAFVMEIGLIAKPVEGLLIGAHVYNPGQARLSNNTDERVPTCMRFGIGYHFSELVLLAVESEKETDAHARFKCGLEYQPVKNLFLRTGFASEPDEFSVGVGYTFRNFTTDIAFSTHQYLPLSTQIALKYSF